jgi:hypothetical protein
MIKLKAYQKEGVLLSSALIKDFDLKVEHFLADIDGNVGLDSLRL